MNSLEQGFNFRRVSFSWKVRQKLYGRFVPCRREWVRALKVEGHQLLELDQP